MLYWCTVGAAWVKKTNCNVYIYYFLNNGDTDDERLTRSFSLSCLLKFPGTLGGKLSVSFPLTLEYRYNQDVLDSFSSLAKVTY